MVFAFGFQKETSGCMGASPIYALHSKLKDWNMNGLNLFQRVADAEDEAIDYSICMIANYG